MKLKLAFSFLLFFLVLFSSCVSHIASTKKNVHKVQKKPLDILRKNTLLKKLAIPNIKYQLKNGLTVILSKDSSTPFVAVSTWYHVGSVNESLEKTGLAHLFEHLMFEGSSHYKADEHFKILDSNGGFSINASTSFDRTNYYQTVRSEQLELVLSLESSRMSFLELTKEKLDEQRQVVRREREQRYEVSPYGQATLHHWQSIFNKSHPYHGRVIGSHEHLESASLTDIKQFYDLHYGPSHATLAIVGDIDIENTKKLIEKYHKSLPASPKRRENNFKEVKLGKEVINTYEETIGRAPLIRLQYLTPGLFKEGDADLDIISDILTGNENSRLTKALTYDNQIASKVYCYQQSLQNQSVFTIDAVLHPSTEPKFALKKIDEVLESLVKTPPTKSKIESAQSQILTSFFFDLQQLGGSRGRVETLQSYDRFANNPNFIAQDMARYMRVTPTSLVKTAKNYLPPGKKRKVLFAIPKSITPSKLR